MKLYRTIGWISLVLGVLFLFVTRDFISWILIAAGALLVMTKQKPKTIKQAIKDATPENVTTFYTKIAGVTHENDDGTSRQMLISQCKKGDLLDLVPDPENEYDKNAIKVVKAYTGEQLGFLSNRLAKETSSYIENGGKANAIVKDITGGGKDKSYGCNILIRKF